MSRRTSRHSRQGFATRRKGQITIVVVVVLSLFAAWTMLAYSGALDSVFRQKRDKKDAVSIASFNSNSPSKEYVYAGGRLVATEEPAATSATQPANLAALANTVGQVHLTWDWSPALGEALDHFVVERRLTITGPPTLLTPSPPTAPNFDDSISFGTVDSTGTITGSVVTYLYRVRAVNTAGSTSEPSNGDLMTTINYSQDEIQQQITTVMKRDLAELRVAVNAVREAAGLNSFAGWTNPDLSQPSITIKTENIAELRGKFDEAFSALSVINPPTQPAYMDPTLQKQFTPVRKAHFNELRKRVRHRST
ncbi:MAG: fibronectin type III domain-containing protein [Acidobacteriota bacterium]